MKIPKAIVVAPGANTLYVSAAMAITLFVFAYSVRFGQVSILALYAVWFLPLLVEPKLLLRSVPQTIALFALAGLAILSTLWSDNPSASLRAGIQYATTIVCAVVAARIAGPRGFAIGGVLGSFAVLGYSILIGARHYDIIDGSFAFVGAFQSKNQLGLFASLALLFAAAALLGRAMGRWVRALGAGLALLAAALLFASESATSILTAAVALALFLGLMVSTRLAPTPRLILIALGVLALSALAIAAAAFGAFDSVLAAFGKDTTLTGRTFLWSEGIRAAAENPLFGMGYSAFWSIGHADAERLWQTFYITARTGFHFHNTFIEVAVALGVVGVAVMVLTLFWLVALSVATALRRAPSVLAILAIAAGALMLARCMVEIDFFTPYTVGTFLVFFAIMRLTEEGAAVRRSRRVHARPVPQALPA